jgi:hypothetical protein
MNRLNESKLQPDDPRLTAFALGELAGDEHDLVAAAVAADRALADAVAEIRATSAQLSAALANEALPEANIAEILLNGNAVTRRASEDVAPAPVVERPGHESWRTHRKVRPFPYFLITSLAAACFVVEFLVRDRAREREAAQRLAELRERQDLEKRFNDGLIIELARSSTASRADDMRASGGSGSSASTGENAFVAVAQNKVSTFPINVATASYADVRGFLARGERPPRDDVRIEEMVNYFPYDYAPPAATDPTPFAPSLEVAAAPWAAGHRLVRIGLKARETGNASNTIAKDVSVQVEFNPAQVQAYRLIGYENHVLAKEDFAKAAVDAGDVGAGHSVTALYDVIPVGVSWKPEAAADAPAYQSPGPTEIASASPTPQSALHTPQSSELLTVTLRYKLPGSDASEQADFALADHGTSFADASADFKFAAAVASFGMLLRDSPHRGDANFASVLAWSEQGRGIDTRGERSEFANLVTRASGILR